MPKGGQYKNLYHVIIDSIHQPVFLGDASGVNGSVVSFQWFHLAGPGSGMFSEFVEESGQFGQCLRSLLLKFLQVFLCVFGKNDGVHVIAR